MSRNPKGGFDLSIPMMVLAHMSDEILMWNPLDDKQARHSFWFTSVPNLQRAVVAFKFKVFKTLQITSWQMALQQALFAKNRLSCKYVSVDPEGDTFDAIGIDDFIEQIKTHIPRTQGDLSGVN